MMFAAGSCLNKDRHCAQVNSFAAQFETAGNSSSYAAVNSFFDSVTSRHSFATGGSNDHEFWGPAMTMADAIMEVGLASPLCFLGKEQLCQSKQ